MAKQRRPRDAAGLFGDSCNISELQLSKFPSATAARDHKTLSNNGSLQEFLSRIGEGEREERETEKRGLEKCVLVLLSELGALGLEQINANCALAEDSDWPSTAKLLAGLQNVVEKHACGVWCWW